MKGETMKKFIFDDTITGYPAKEYPIARALRIGSCEPLYTLERRVTETIDRAAREITKLADKNHLGWPEENHYSHAVPQSLMAALDAFDLTSGEVAAISFLLSRGYEVSKVEKE